MERRGLPARPLLSYPLPLSLRAGPLLDVVLQQVRSWRRKDHDHYEPQSTAAGQLLHLARNPPDLTFGLLLEPLPQSSTLSPAFSFDLWLA